MVSLPPKIAKVGGRVAIWRMKRSRGRRPWTTGGGWDSVMPLSHLFSFGVGVERTFPLHSPSVAKLELVTHGKVRRAKLYYLRDLTGKKSRIRERRLSPEELAAEAAARRAQEHGLQKVDVFVNGPGSGRETAIRLCKSCHPMDRVVQAPPSGALATPTSSAVRFARYGSSRA